MTTAKVTGLNHLTFAVSDLERSITFYRDLLGFDQRAIWATGAYLEAGSLWLCLSLDEAARREPRPDYTHAALTVDAAAFETLSARVRTAATLWKDNRSEGASLYFLDPDGHRLELHVGDLESRLADYRARAGMAVLIS
ncbi:MAG: glutathione transferase [Brevundimonas sp.]|nr:MAG: glutathione transferase [Brevundimonas sp.]